MADNRENTILQAIAEGETVDDARTSDEVFLKAIADGAEKPEEIRNRLQYWLSQIDGGGGGGNPNTVEVIIGTIQNPWGNHNASDILSMANSPDYTIIFYGLPLGRALLQYSIQLRALAVSSVYEISGELIIDSVIINYSDDLSLSSSKIYDGRWTTLPPSAPVEVHIIHHPLP